jgi:hypothetical protein
MTHYVKQLPTCGKTAADQHDALCETTAYMWKTAANQHDALCETTADNILQNVRQLPPTTETTTADEHYVRVLPTAVRQHTQPQSLSPKTCLHKRTWIACTREGQLSAKIVLYNCRRALCETMPTSIM